METFLVLASIIVVLAVGVVSPGPSFILVARTAVAFSRTAAVASAFGMATGATALCLVALLGLHAILTQVPTAYIALKLVGGAYLLYLALKTWRAADKPLALQNDASSSSRNVARHFLLAAGTMVSNPKAAVQYGVIFAAILPPTPSPALMTALPPSVFLLEASWYLVVAIALSASKPKAVYLKAKGNLDRVAGAVLALLGCRLMLAAR